MSLNNILIFIFCLNLLFLFDFNFVMDKLKKNKEETPELEFTDKEIKEDKEYKKITPNDFDNRINNIKKEMQNKVEVITDEYEKRMYE